jgi:hypothetical protein
LAAAHLKRRHASAEAPERILASLMRARRVAFLTVHFQ